MFCFWCQHGTVPKRLDEKGFVWIHLECLMEISELRDDIRGVKAILAGKRNESVERFLHRMQQFDTRWNNLESLLTKKSTEKHHKNTTGVRPNEN